MIFEILHYHVPKCLRLLYNWIVLTESFCSFLFVSFSKGDSVLWLQFVYFNAGLDNVLQSIVATYLIDLSVADSVFDIVRLE